MNKHDATYSDTERLLHEYAIDKTVQKLRNYFNEQSTMSIYGIERKEIYHTNFIEWILTDDELCKPAIKRLFLLLYERQAIQTKADFPDSIKKAILTTNFNVDKVKTLRKAAGNSGFVDLLLEIQYNKGRILYFIIENKIDSDEHLAGSTEIKQTTYYYSYYTKTPPYDKADKIFVYLDAATTSADLMSNTEAVCDCKKYIHINYQDILNSILSELRVDDSIQLRKRFIIDDYIKSLSKIKKEKTIMAIEDEQKKLLKTFWENNSDLIKLALKALADDGDEDAVQAYKSATNTNKEYSVIIGMNRKDNLSARDAAKCVAEELAKRYELLVLLTDFGKLEKEDKGKFDLQKTERLFFVEETKTIRVFKEVFLTKDKQNVKCNNVWTVDKVESLKKSLKDKNIEDISIE